MNETRNNKKSRKSLSDSIKEANREIYNSLSPENYNSNESIFNASRRRAVTDILAQASERSGSDAYLDIATGTGNLLAAGEGCFKSVYAVDIADNLLRQIKSKYPSVNFAAADAENLPFKEGAFNCVSCYAMLHHLLEHEKLFKECHRVLKSGGTLYTDHDPNYFFTRFHRIFYRIKHGNTPGFGSETEELAEYHNSYSSGINPEKLRKLLLDSGFSTVKIGYRVTDSEKYSGIANFARNALRLTASVIPLKSFHTHFSIIAIKS
jgi:ubiquinone/menaquinone biosynthesis C-methylase UbiE